MAHWDLSGFPNDAPRQCVPAFPLPLCFWEVFTTSDMCLNSKGQVETPLFPCSSFHLLSLTPFFSRIFSAFRSWLELSVGHRHTSRPTHAGCSTVVTQLITWLRITPEWTFGRVFFCFFFSSVRCMEKLRNLSISGHSQHLLRRKRRSARREGTERERGERRHHAICSLSTASQMWSGT